MIKAKGNTYCMGIECPVKNRCIRYTRGISATMYDGTLDNFIRKCTNQKNFIQDKTNVVDGR